MRAPCSRLPCSRVALGLVIGLVLPLGGCQRLKQLASRDAGTDAASSTPATSSAPLVDAAAPPKRLDATTCNPGKSVEPVDKGKVVQSDQFKYTLLDVRADEVTSSIAKGKKVILVKLQVENITSKPNLNMSVTDVDLVRDDPKADRVKNKALHYRVDIFYNRSDLCVDLGADVKPGSIPPGTKVVGYYVFSDEGASYKSLWFNVRNVSPESVTKGDFLDVAGSLRIK